MEAVLEQDGLGDFASFTPLDEGWYEAELVVVQNKKMPWQDKQTGEDVYRWEWEFILSEPGYEGRKVWGTNVPSFNKNPDNRNFQWTLVLLGQSDLEPGFRVDFDNLVGRRCRIMVNKRSYEKNGVTKWVNEVVEMMPSRSAGYTGPTDQDPFHHAPTAMRSTGWRPGSRKRPLSARFDTDLPF